MHFNHCPTHPSCSPNYRMSRHETVTDFRDHHKQSRKVVWRIPKYFLSRAMCHSKFARSKFGYNMMKRAVALFFHIAMLCRVHQSYYYYYYLTCESVTWVNTEAIVVTRQKPRKTILLTCYYLDGVKSTICSMMGVNLTCVYYPPYWGGNDST